MFVSEIELYEALSQQIGAEKAKTLIKYVESKVDKRLEENTRLFATKEDIANLKSEIANAKVDIIRWVVATGIALAGLIVAVVKFL